METINDTIKRIEFWQGKLPNKYGLIPDAEHWFEILAYHRHEFEFVCAEVRGNFHNDVNVYLAYIYKKVCSNVNYMATNKVYLKNF